MLLLEWRIFICILSESISVKIICNKNASKILLANGKNNLTILDWKQTKKISIKGYEIEIETIPAVHGINPLSAFFAGKGNGYYLTITKENESFKIYITGDTVYKNKIIKLLKNKKIDLIIPNMGAAKQGSWIMTLTLNAKMLKRMISKLNPETVIPVHYGTFEHYKEPVKKIKELNDKRIKIVEAGSKTALKIKNAGK